MAESSSDSDHFRYHDRLSRWATRTIHRETGSHPTVDVTAKVNTITSTLQVSLTVVTLDRFLSSLSRVMVTACISFYFSTVINDPQVTVSKQPSLLSHSSVGPKKENSLPLPFVAAPFVAGISSKPAVMVVLPSVAFGWLCPPFCLPFPFFFFLLFVFLVLTQGLAHAMQVLSLPLGPSASYPSSF